MRWLLITLALTLPADFAARADSPMPRARRLKLANPIRSSLRGGESQLYALDLKNDQYFRIVLTPPGFATTLRLRAAGTKENLVELHLAGGGRAWMAWIAKSSGRHEIEVAAPAGGVSSPAQYTIKLEELRPSEPGDEKRLESQRLFEEARQARLKKDYETQITILEDLLTLVRELKDPEGQVEALHALGGAYSTLRQSEKAIGNFERAVAIAQASQDWQGETSALNELADVYRYLGQGEKAIQYFERAQALIEKAKNQMAESIVLYNLGLVYAGLSQGEKALEYYQRSLAMSRKIKDRVGEGMALDRIGSTYVDLGQNEKAIDYFEQALRVARANHDRASEGNALNDIGIAYDNLSQFDKAVNFYEQTLAVRRELKDRRGEAIALNNLGIAHDNLSQFGDAIRCYEQALAIKREIKDRRSEGATLGNLGIVYDKLGQYQQAVDYYDRALAITREVKDRRTEGFNLTNLGSSYSHLKQYQKAIDYYDQALVVLREIQCRECQGGTLMGLGAAYREVSQYDKAIDYYEQALTIMRELKDRLGEGLVLKDLGVAYYDLGQRDKAIAEYEHALAIQREIKDRSGEASALTGLMNVWSSQANPLVAIFYGKEAVNAIQAIRADSRGLSQELQRSFLKGNEEPYHQLAELLVMQGRLTEAEQVLALLKEEEYFQYVRRDAGEASSLNRHADLTQDEAEWEKRYREIGDRLMTIGVERGELLSKKTLTAEQSQRLSQLEQDLAVGNQAFEHFLGDLATHFSAKPELNAKVVEQIREDEGFMEDLRELPAGTVAIYTLAGEDKFHAILRTPDAQKAYEYPIKASDLNRKVFEFRTALNDPQADPRPLAHELYQILIAPMADDLRQAKAQTLMWSLDGALRYVPIQALYDGQEYLIERYRVSVMTLASRARLKDRPDSAWSAAGFGVTKKHEDNEALPEVAAELEGVEAILHGEIKLDEQFTEASMRVTLLKRFPVVHIASHFRFQPGDQSKSFLLLGDGGHLSLAELKTLPNLFTGVQLLTLSACNTGVGDGTEVEGFGTLAQRQGAKAVVASLWPVADQSTSRLMREFYRIRESSPSTTKLEALREAQLELLHGEIKQPNQDYRHPFYWAPFFLMGNWL